MTEEPSILVVDGHLSAADLVRAAGLPGRLAHRCAHCGSSDHGQPVLDGGPFVSVARSSEVSVIAWCAAGAVGVDVELIGAAAPRELTLHTAEPFDDVLAVWVRKEAVLKAMGTGLRVEPLTIRLRDGAPGIMTVAGSRLRVRDVKVPGHVAAVCW